MKMESRKFLPNQNTRHLIGNDNHVLRNNFSTVIHKLNDICHEDVCGGGGVEIGDIVPVFLT
jgi:hypothetical protein